MKKMIKYLILILILLVIAIITTIIITRIKGTNNDELYTSEVGTAEKPSERYTKEKEKYECNEFDYENVSKEQLVLLYFNKFKTNEMIDLEKAYENLDNEYRNKKFGSIDQYKLFVKYNYDKISLSTLSSYKVKETNGNTQYICIDNNGNYYIFNETAVMQYSVILDTYTLDMPEFLEKYNSTNEQGKCALNLQKFMQAINDGDYKYAYNCLSEGFKNNYFKTQDDFEKYVEENFYTNNSVNYKTFESKAGVYTYELELTDSENEASEKIVKTFVIKLNDGTGFELSFNM